MNRLIPSMARTTRIVVAGAILTTIAIGGTFLLDPYRNYQLATIAAIFCATAGLTLLVGLSGQLSLGHAALMAVGGYGYALANTVLTEAGIDGALRFVIGMMAGVVTAGGLGLLLGLAAARLQGPYLAGLTLAVVIALPAVTAVFSGVLGGDEGLQTAYDGVPTLLRTAIAVEQWQAWVSILVAGVVVTALAILARGRLGLHMRAVRDDEVAAGLNGVRAGRVKVAAFTWSAVAAGAGGAVLCFVTQSVSPGAYTLAFSLLLVVAVVVGGLGSIGGAAIGSALIVLLPWLIETAAGTLELPAGLEQRLAGNVAILVFGALLIMVAIAWPARLAGARRRTRTAPKPTGTIADATTTPRDPAVPDTGSAAPTRHGSPVPRGARPDDLVAPINAPDHKSVPADQIER
ncbi:branched-chain amino acid ABC transporter permease [Herbiconiux ginsengi]|uniref:Amino acid/amide ABC transporter membrane protein 2, HAAT family n=1 Tax=Herbiconiux ginsengi TaxID=381665 RepID=A0A1H3KHZ2_9MICO|nr:branched-chain amino acid ABC transporter permease [Herbiconiux ginsengi]SDY51736.1 amino acid/amide ABC transporter membrane protein 2, HAAT family [Herbiconiux ginsengi]